MSEPMAGALAASALLLSAILTGWLRGFALSRGVIDVPNVRSSHVRPTPRGGGVAVVVVVLSALPLLAWSGLLAAPVVWAVLGAGLLVGGVGWLDDRGDVPARWRLLVHFVAAVWGIAWLAVLDHPPSFVPGWIGWISVALAAPYLVWVLNLYNFMDGIDGIAGIEALTVCGGAIVLYRLLPGSGTAWVIPLLLAAAVAGFLVWNFPRARVFMGDSGSGFIGITLGLLSLHAGVVAPVLFWGWVILLGAFVVDATVTLGRRLARGERVYQAHRSHAYQHLARRLGAHPPVSLAFGAVNVVWLLPIAAGVVMGWVGGMLGLLVAYTPLVGLALLSGAGRPEEGR